MIKQEFIMKGGLCMSCVQNKNTIYLVTGGITDTSGAPYLFH